MSELLGIIAPLRKFLSNDEQEINIENFSLILKSNRKYIIPDFQREIRWTIDNVDLLLDDIFHNQRYLGNIIMTKKPNNDIYMLIDGQQRITTLIMILYAIIQLHDGTIETIEPCELHIESFKGYNDLLKSYFAEETCRAVVKTDKLHQMEKYRELWEFIKQHEVIANKDNAKKLLENLRKSEINILLNQSDDVSDGIRYFIDVNLKSKQLDVEDIFKSYLFRNDPRQDIRDAWYLFKTKMAIVKDSSMEYPLLDVLNHFIYCDLYKNPRFKGLDFGEDFLLRKKFRKQEEGGTNTYRAGTHLIEVINDNQYMLNAFRKINEVLDIMLNIVRSTSTTTDFTRLFTDKYGEIDSVELRIIHNIIGKVLRDKDKLPKALVMKYILTVLLGTVDSERKAYRKIYGVYLLSIFFWLFENRKSRDIILNVLKASDDKWYDEAIKQIKSYFSADRISDARLVAANKMAVNENEENYKFRCKSLATIYNFFEIRNDKVQIISGKMMDLQEYIFNDKEYSIEHFVISENQSVNINDLHTFKYEAKFYKQYSNNLFNFIFIERSINSSLENYWLPRKMELIKDQTINCEYSKMVLSNLGNLSREMQECILEKDGEIGETVDDKIFIFLNRDFKEKYIDYAKKVLKDVISKMNKDL